MANWLPDVQAKITLTPAKPVSKDSLENELSY